MATQKDRVVVEIVVNSKGANAALKKINGNLTKIQKSAKSTSDHLRFFRDVTGLATFAIALNRITASFIKVNIQAQKLEKGFTAVLGSSELAADQMNRAREIADRLGLDYLSSSQSLVQLTAASKGTSLAGEETLRIFEAVSGAMSLLGKSADDTKGALKSIEQMINKGSIAAE
ncbi:MAG: tape measure protein, partial [Woeseiaceae bacterium]